MLICILYTCSFIARKLGQGVFKGEIMQSWRSAGECVLHVSLDNQLLGSIIVACLLLKVVASTGCTYSCT